jgi:hypothetical protein
MFGLMLQYWCSSHHLRLTHSGQVFGPASRIIINSTDENSPNLPASFLLSISDPLALPSEIKLVGVRVGDYDELQHDGEDEGKEY